MVPRRVSDFGKLIQPTNIENFNHSVSHPIRLARDLPSKEGMIELHLYLRAPPRQTHALVAALQSLARVAGLERGCLEAHVFTESNDPRCLYYSEAWDAEENLRSMLRSERFTHLVELMELAAEPPSLAFWTISETRGLEFAWQARQSQKKDTFTLGSG